MKAAVFRFGAEPESSGKQGQLSLLVPGIIGSAGEPVNGALSSKLFGALHATMIASSRRNFAIAAGQQSTAYCVHLSRLCRGIPAPSGTTGAIIAPSN
jgi:hypothetical protein